MAVSVREIHPDMLYQLTITNTAVDVELLRWTYATGALSSSYLSERALMILQARFDNLLSPYNDSMKQAQIALLSHVVYVSEGRGALNVAASSFAGYNSLALSGLDSSTDYSVLFGVPHSGSLYLSRGIL